MGAANRVFPGETLPTYRQTPTAGALAHPDFSGLARYQKFSRPDDDEAATSQTIAQMWRLAWEDSRSEILRRAAAQATQGKRQPADLAAAIFAWVRSRVRFREDREAAAPLAGIVNPDTTEVLIRPVDLLTMPRPAGDCDDFAMLTAALLLAVGIEPAFITIAADPAMPALYSHVYAAAILPAGPLEMDTSYGDAPGWHAPAAGKTKTWRLPDMQTLGAIDWSKILTTGVEAAAKITTARYGVAPAGTYSQTAAGDINYRQPAGSGPLTFPGVQIGGGYTWVLVALGVLTLVLIAARKS